MTLDSRKDNLNARNYLGGYFMLKKVLAFCFTLLLLFYSVPVHAAGVEEQDWQDQMIYYLIVDRFNNGDSSNDKNVNALNPLGYQGGDFQGIIDKLDYLEDLGFTTVMLSPIFDNDDKGYDGSRIKDYYKTEEHFGSLKSFKKLVKEVHNRDMKIIIDFPTYQVSPENSLVQDSAKKDWFNGTTKDQLPVLNQENSQVKQYLIDAAKWWVNQTDIDGYFLSDADHFPESFWKEFSSTVKSKKSDLYLLGEVSSNSLIKNHEKAGFDGMMDHNLNQPMRDAFSNINQPIKPVLDIINQHKETYKNANLIGAFYDNPNMKRYTRDMVNNNLFPGTRWKLALTYLYTQPEIPIVYYGTEIAVDGGNAPENRQMMNFRADKELIDYMTMIGEIRQMQPALRRGTMKTIYDKDGMVVFKREYKGKINIVAINNTDKTQIVNISQDKLQDNKELRGLISGGIEREDNGVFKLALDRETSEIYNVVEKTGINYVMIAVLVAIWVAFILFVVTVRKRGKNKKVQ